MHIQFTRFCKLCARTRLRVRLGLVLAGFFIAGVTFFTSTASLRASLLPVPAAADLSQSRRANARIPGPDASGDSRQELQILLSHLNEASFGDLPSPTDESGTESVAASSFEFVDRTDHPAAADFPVFDHAVFPVSKIPNLGAMRQKASWDFNYDQLTDADFVPVPAYDLKILAGTRFFDLKEPYTPEDEAIATTKLFYITHYMGDYDMDADEFTGIHPAIDLKLARGTPVGALAGGRVNAAGREGEYGLRVIIEHWAPDGQRYFSVYAHLDSIKVQEGDAVTPGEIIGTVGLTGHTTGPHLHLAVDRAIPGEKGHHIIYLPKTVPTREEAAKYSINPIEFIAKYSEKK